MRLIAANINAFLPFQQEGEKKDFSVQETLVYFVEQECIAHVKKKPKNNPPALE